MAAFSQSPGPHAGSSILTAEGDLDITSSEDFGSWLAAASREHRYLVLDMSAVTFIDTSALAVLVSTWKQLSSTGGTLLLAGPRYRNTKTLWITGLADRLPVYATVGEAVAALPGAAQGGGQAAPAGTQGSEQAAPS